MGDLKSFFGKNNKGLKRRAGSRELALEFDESPVLFGVHFQSTPAQRSAHPLPYERGVFTDSTSEHDGVGTPQGSEITTYSLDHAIGKHIHGERDLGIFAIVLHQNACIERLI